MFKYIIYLFLISTGFQAMAQDAGIEVDQSSETTMADAIITEDFTHVMNMRFFQVFPIQGVLDYGEDFVSEAVCKSTSMGHAANQVPGFEFNETNSSELSKFGVVLNFSGNKQPDTVTIHNFESGEMLELKSVASPEDKEANASFEEMPFPYETYQQWDRDPEGNGPANPIRLLISLRTTLHIIESEKIPDLLEKIGNAEKGDPSLESLNKDLSVAFSEKIVYKNLIEQYIKTLDLDVFSNEDKTVFYESFRDINDFRWILAGNYVVVSEDGKASINKSDYPLLAEYTEALLSFFGIDKESIENQNIQMTLVDEEGTPILEDGNPVFKNIPIISMADTFLCESVQKSAVYAGMNAENYQGYLKSVENQGIKSRAEGTLQIRDFIEMAQEGLSDDEKAYIPEINFYITQYIAGGMSYERALESFLTQVQIYDNVSAVDSKGNEVSVKGIATKWMAKLVPLLKEKEEITAANQLLLDQERIKTEPLTNQDIFDIVRRRLSKEDQVTLSVINSKIQAGTQEGKTLDEVIAALPDDEKVVYNNVLEQAKLVGQENRKNLESTDTYQFTSQVLETLSESETEMLAAMNARAANYPSREDWIADFSDEENALFSKIASKILEQQNRFSNNQDDSEKEDTDGDLE